jgi:hypothetical protein
MTDTSHHDQSIACELCGEATESPVLTGDSHPEGPNHVVGDCCAHTDPDRELPE